MDKNIKRWISIMEWFSKYWGCHQIPERSFNYKGYQFPICARSTGILLGEIFGIIVGIISNYYSFWILTIMIPMILDGSIQLFFKNYESNNFKRLITGLCFGFAFTFSFIEIIKLIISI